MKVSINWLKEFVNLGNKTASDLDDIFSLKLTELESNEKLCSTEGLTIGLVKECVMHPDSDHLHICQVEVRPGQVEQIVCGAPNVAAGEKVIVANIGCVLPGDFKIKPSKLRGVESNGMLCSFDEIGIDNNYCDPEYRDGIYLLDKDAPVGEDPIKYLGLDDIVLGLDLTPNRADLLSMIGVSYDIATVLGEDVKLHEPQVKEVKMVNPVKVEVNTDNCYQYHARYIKNVKIKKSPWWLRERLIANGIRPINNVVDISNYVLLEYGQPLHTFDGDKLGNKIVVRMANDGEKFVTLDEVERTLTKDDIVITDGVKPVCLGGVMGGLDTGVSDETTNVILEAAEFDPTCVRKTSARLGLRSESSFRFERKIDYNRVTKALDRAAELLSELAEGEVVGSPVSVIKKTHEPITIKVSLAKINSYMGVNLTVAEVSDILSRMHFDFEVKEEEYTVNVPSRRIDYDNNYQDLIEDIARFYGFDKIPTTIPSTSDCGKLTKEQSLERSVRNVLCGLGMNEAICYSLTSEEALNEFTLEENDPIKLLMPFTEDRSLMRQSLIPSLLDVVSYNKARKIDSVKFYEISDCYSVNGSKKFLSGALSGIYEKSLWQQRVVKVDFFLVKGILDTLFNKLGLEATYTKAELKNLHPGKTAMIKIRNEEVGFIGAIHPKYQKAHGLNETYVFELDFAKLIQMTNANYNYEPVSKFPSITRDLAIVCKKDIDASEIYNLIKQTGKKTLVDIELFDLYMDESIGNENKQLAYKLTFMDRDKTLESSDVDKIIKQILKRLEFTYQATLRQ